MFLVENNFHEITFLFFKHCASFDWIPEELYWKLYFSLLYKIFNHNYRNWSFFTLMRRILPFYDWEVCRKSLKWDTQRVRNNQSFLKFLSSALIPFQRIYFSLMPPYSWRTCSFVMTATLLAALKYQTSAVPTMSDI